MHSVICALYVTPIKHAREEKGLAILLRKETEQTGLLMKTVETT